MSPNAPPPITSTSAPASACLSTPQTDANKVRLNAAIASANRHNLAIYPVDAVGLRVHSQDTANAEAHSAPIPSTRD